MFMGLTEFVLRHPKWVIIATVVATLLLGHGMRYMRADTDVTNDLPQDIPAKRLYDQIDEIFPAKEMVIVGIASDDLFTVAGVAKLDRITRRLEKLAEVQSVISPTNARIISAIEGGMEVKEAADPLPKTAAGAAAFKARLFSQPLFIGSVVSEDAAAIAMMVFIKAGVREADCAEKVIAIANDPKQNEGYTLHVTGRAAATYWAKVIMARDMGMLSSAALLIVVVLLLLFFRSGRGLGLPVGVVVCSVVWTLGLMGYLGQPITHSTEVMPILLIAIGVADGIHILKGYYAQARTGGTPEEVVRATMADLNRPVILTSITTALGFVALSTSGITSITILGVFTAFGVIAAMIFSITFLPAVLCLMKLPARKAKAAATGGRFVVFEAAAAAYAGALVRHKAAMGVFILAVVGGAIFGATRVVSEFSSLSNFRSDHPFRLATEAVNQHFASVSSLAVVVEGGEPDAIKDPVVLKKMDALATFLADRPHIGNVQSLTGFIKQMHRVMHGDTEAQYRLPNVVEHERGFDLVEENGIEKEVPVEFDVPGKELVAQYLTLYEMSGKPGDFANMVTYDFSTSRMNVMVGSDRATVLTEVHDAVRGYIDENFAGVKAELTGMAELMRAVNEMVVNGQAWSILTSLILVLIVTALMFRSLLLGVFCTLPLFFSLFLNFGTMGLTGIALNIMTMATSSVAVGVGIDYAIHFVHNYQHDRQRGLSYGEAAIATMRASDVAIFLNALTVAAGFFALFFSEFGGVAEMGILIALTMLTSAFAALTILPVIFVTFKPKVFSVVAATDSAAAAAEQLTEEAP